MSDEDDVPYGDWQSLDPKALAVAEGWCNPEQDIWPRWTEGVPTKLFRRSETPAFVKNGVHHRKHYSLCGVELSWGTPRTISSLKQNQGLLPGKASYQWAGVYRLFAHDAPIDRWLCADPTGTLYIGMAGVGESISSTLRVRIKSIVRGEHHAVKNVIWDGELARRFPWESLEIQWAYVGMTHNYLGDPIPGARMAEAYLLNCYYETFGELPPLNRRN